MNRKEFTLLAAALAGWIAASASAQAPAEISLTRFDCGKTTTVSDVGRFSDVAAFKGLTIDGPRGTVMIDPGTRDIVEDERAMEVYRKPDGKLGLKVLGTIAQVKDQCKEQKVGRCGQQ